MDPEIPCVCTDAKVRSYFGKIAGPLQDRIDIEVLLGRVPYRDLMESGSAESSEAIRARVVRARQVQSLRFAGSVTTCNSRMSNQQVRDCCRLDCETEALLETAIKRLNLSARSFFRILKVGRTIADLAGAEAIAKAHILEALSYKNLHRLYNMR